MAELNRSGCKVEFNQRKALIYNTEGKLIGNRDQTKGNLFYLDEASEIFLMVRYYGV